MLIAKSLLSFAQLCIGLLMHFSKRLVVSFSAGASMLHFIYTFLVRIRQYPLFHCLCPILKISILFYASLRCVIKTLRRTNCKYFPISLFLELNQEDFRSKFPKCSIPPITYPNLLSIVYIDMKLLVFSKIMFLSLFRVPLCLQPPSSFVTS